MELQQKDDYIGSRPSPDTEIYSPTVVRDKYLLFINFPGSFVTAAPTD